MDHARERRRAPRTSDAEGRVAARVRPGRDAVVINLSRDGALIETPHRLLPGTIVDLQLDASARRIVIRGRVLRCAVAVVRPSSLVYRGAIAFDRALAWPPDENGEGGNALPDDAKSPPARSRASHTHDRGR